MLLLAAALAVYLHQALQPTQKNSLKTPTDEIYQIFHQQILLNKRSERARERFSGIPRNSLLQTEQRAAAASRDYFYKRKQNEKHSRENYRGKWKEKWQSNEADTKLIYMRFHSFLLMLSLNLKILSNE
jgi:hypothetical protein